MLDAQDALPEMKPMDCQGVLDKQRQLKSAAKAQAMEPKPKGRPKAAGKAKAKARGKAKAKATALAPEGNGEVQDARASEGEGEVQDAGAPEGEGEVQDAPASWLDIALCMLSLVVTVHVVWDGLGPGDWGHDQYFMSGFPQAQVPCWYG